MPMIRVNAQADEPQPEGDLDAALAALPPGAPVIILIHGFKFSPSGTTNPHEHILSLSPTARCRKAISWPHHLGFGRGDPNEGLCIAFGWEACGTIWAARREAARASLALARLIDRIGRPVHVVAHSLGARVALGAPQHLGAGQIDRLILLAAAAFRSEAQASLCAPAARAMQVLNITSRENDLFDAVYEALIWHGTRDSALGAGLGHTDARWLDIQIDCAHTLDRLRGLGFVIAGSQRRICHWSAYLRPGLFAFYSAVLREPERLKLPLLAHHLPKATARRWSRLIARPALPLPFVRKTSF